VLRLDAAIVAMITRQITPYGRNTAGLLSYVLGPARDGVSEHLDPRIIDGWRPDLAEKTGWQMAKLMDVPMILAGAESVPHVWHVIVSTQRAEGTTPADRPLDDATFAAIARDVVERCGMNKTRWLAARHDEPGKEHCHVVATLAANGKRVHPAWPQFKMRDVAREWEERLDLQRTPGAGEGRPERYPTRGEVAKARDRGMSTTFREAARHEAMKAARDARTPDDFAREMQRRGVETHVRRDPKTGRATGFAVRAMDGVWFKGSHLDRDLKKLMGRLEALSRTVDNTRELQAQATQAAAERRGAERDAQIRRAYTLPDRETEMAR
jgi:hypothetical protein